MSVSEAMCAAQTTTTSGKILTHANSGVTRPLFRARKKINSGVCAVFWTSVFLATFKCSIGYAQDLPQICSVNNTKVWYFQIGSSEFEIIDPQEKFHGLLSNDKDVPNESSGAVGCKSNPQKLSDIYFNGLPIIGQMPGLNYPREFGAIELWKYTEYPGMSPALDVDLFFRESDLIDCKNKKHFTRFSDGTILCSNANEAINALSDGNAGKPPIENSFDYLFSEKTYSTPLGEPFFTSYDQSTMNVRYLAKEDLGIRYVYGVPPVVRNILPSYVIAVDQSFRTTIAALENLH